MTFYERHRVKSLASYSRLLALKGSGWLVVSELACVVAVRAFENAREADACAELVAERADA